ncbi:hypothetical protein SETIT_2G264700v2 [Setaria italica]|uniref:Uncharacterized protein n=1 Tax=Setaria italica TaxID=4555 RepID=A0A368Q3W4_SETIT|nr:hypothetical protein SETIT_2G264700v2 [Setaria italica]
MAKAVQAPRGSENQSRHLFASAYKSVEKLKRLICCTYRSMRMEGRLLPFNFEDSDGFPLYQTYLENFYHRHKNPADVSITDAAFKCLKENNLRLSWLPFKAIVIPSDALLSNDIFDCMLQLVQNRERYLQKKRMFSSALLKRLDNEVTEAEGVQSSLFPIHPEPRYSEVGLQSCDVPGKMVS